MRNGPKRPKAVDDTNLLISGTILKRGRDKKDEIILAAASGGKAGYLVTGDDDLLALRGDPRLGRLQIVKVTEFLEMLPAPGQDGGGAP